jgi:hypothetical protein
MEVKKMEGREDEEEDVWNYRKEEILNLETGSAM